MEAGFCGTEGALQLNAIDTESLTLLLKKTAWFLKCSPFHTQL